MIFALQGWVSVPKNLQARRLNPAGFAFSLVDSSGRPEAMPGLIPVVGFVVGIPATLVSRTDRLRDRSLNQSPPVHAGGFFVDV
jgi:hypothetical protein